MGDNKIMENNTFENFVPVEQKSKLIQTILLEFNRSSTEIEASAVVSMEGVTIASALMDDVDVNQVGVMCASLSTLAVTASATFKHGKLKQLMIDAERGFVLIVDIGEKAALVLVTHTNANLGMVFLEARKTVQHITKILG